MARAQWFQSRLIKARHALSDQSSVYTMRSRLDPINTTEKAIFPVTYCSQCGGTFGPGNSGFSHCRDHGAKKAA